MGDFHVEIGARTEFTKTVGGTDVYMFAGITGDFSPNHVNQAYMEKSQRGEGWRTGRSWPGSCRRFRLWRWHTRGSDETPVAVVFDKPRFLAPVFLGDTVTTACTISEVDQERKRSTSENQVTNQDGTLVSVAKHIPQWVKN